VGEWTYRSTFLDLSTSWRTRPLYPRGRSPRTHWIEVGWNPEPVWTTWRRENSWPYRDSNSDPSVVQPVDSRYTDYAVAARSIQYLTLINLSMLFRSRFQNLKCILLHNGCEFVVFLHTVVDSKWSTGSCGTPIAPTCNIIEICFWRNYHLY
jgi:hypothetical protein